MTNQELNTINIKGKEYVPVSERIKKFNHDFPEGSITTQLVSDPTSENIIIKATVIPKEGRTFTGYSQATVDDGYINKTSALENAETSAVGRALGMMGIGILDSVASADEMNKAANTPKKISNPDLLGACTFKGCELKGFTADFIAKSKEEYGTILCYKHQQVTTRG